MFALRELTRFKHRYVQQSAIMLRDHFEGDVPQNVDDLCKLPGVGPKVAFLTLQNAWDMLVLFVFCRACAHVIDCRCFRNTGIGVDVHVERITNRLGWHVPSTNGVPEKARSIPNTEIVYCTP